MTPGSVWFRDRAARRFVACPYLAWLAALNLAWEIAQLPPYSLWTEASFAYKAFAMPTLDLAGARIGLSPLLQWLVLPPLALHMARRSSPLT